MIPIIATYRATLDILHKFNIIAKKSYGQNFIIDQHVLNKIVASSGITSEDTVLEIGPGIGGLTEILAAHAGEVVAVEIDERFIPVLEYTLRDCGNVSVILGDILSFDLEEFTNKCNNKVKIVANLPYCIAANTIMQILEKELPITSLTVMVQKEVGTRMTAVPGTKDYGALSLAVAYYADYCLAANVPRNCFIPRPNVDSVIVRLDIRDKPAVDVDDKALFFNFIKAGFFQRRKTLLNCLSNYPNIRIDKPTALKLLEKCKFPDDIRGECLTLYDYAKLCKEYCKLII